MNHQKSTHMIMIVCALFFFTANAPWANAEQDGQEGVEVEQNAGSVRGSDEMKAAGEVAQESVEEPTGLDIVMDGTSLDAWNQSMDKVKEVGGPKEYGRLKDAFDYLLMFDVGAKNDPATLASRLNGLTGNEILKRVAYRKGG